MTTFADRVAALSTACNDAAPADRATVTSSHADVVATLRNDMRAARMAKLAEAERTRQAAARADALRAEIAAVKAELDATPVARLKKFLADRAAVHNKAANALEWFRHGDTVSTEDMRAAQPVDDAKLLAGIFKEADGWRQFDDGLVEEAMPRLEKEVEFLAAEGCDGATLTDVKATLDEARELFEKNVTRWMRECSRRMEYTKLLGEFEADRAKLVQWCRQQVATLNNLQQPDHIQEFCASFHINTPVMESNFLILMEASDALLPNAEVERLLIEVAEVWLGLETFAFEKLRSTLLDLHGKSGIETAAQVWPEYSKRLKAFLVDAEQLLQMPTDPESQEVAQPLKEQCKQLQTDNDAHLLIVEHLADFSLREECIKEHYNAIHKTVFSKLTLLTQAFPALYAYERKQEYTDRMSQLGQWIQSKSQNAAWKQLLGRVDGMKKLIEDNELTQKATEERF
jgi:hypothetical protein